MNDSQSEPSSAYPWSARDDLIAKDFLTAAYDNVEWIMPDNVHPKLRDAIESNNPIEEVYMVSVANEIIKDFIVIEEEEFRKLAQQHSITP